MNAINNSCDADLQHMAKLLSERLIGEHLTLCTAESCTGGWIAKILTDIPGSSAWFDCGMAAYSYEAKQALLRVRPETLMTHGAVSRETAVEMVVETAIPDPTLRNPQSRKSLFPNLTLRSRRR